MEVAHVCLPGGGYSDLVVKNGNFTRSKGLIEVHACIRGVNLRDGIIYVCKVPSFGFLLHCLGGELHGKWGKRGVQLI